MLSAILNQFGRWILPARAPARVANNATSVLSTNAPHSTSRMPGEWISSVRPVTAATHNQRKRSRSLKHDAIQEHVTKKRKQDAKKLCYKSEMKHNEKEARMKPAKENLNPQRPPRVSEDISVCLTDALHLRVVEHEKAAENMRRDLEQKLREKDEAVAAARKAQAEAQAAQKKMADHIKDMTALHEWYLMEHQQHLHDFEERAISRDEQTAATVNVLLDNAVERTRDEVSAEYERNTGELLTKHHQEIAAMQQQHEELARASVKAKSDLATSEEVLKLERAKSQGKGLIESFTKAFLEEHDFQEQAFAEWSVKTSIWEHICQRQLQHHHIREWLFAELLQDDNCRAQASRIFQSPPEKEKKESLEQSSEKDGDKDEECSENKKEKKKEVNEKDIDNQYSEPHKLATALGSDSLQHEQQCQRDAEDIFDSRGDRGKQMLGNESATLIDTQATHSLKAVNNSITPITHKTTRRDSGIDSMFAVKTMTVVKPGGVPSDRWLAVTKVPSLSNTKSTVSRECDSTAANDLFGSRQVLGARKSVWGSSKLITETSQTTPEPSVPAASEQMTAGRERNGSLAHQMAATDAKHSVNNETNGEEQQYEEDDDTAEISDTFVQNSTAGETVESDKQAGDLNKPSESEKEKEGSFNDCSRTEEANHPDGDVAAAPGGSGGPAGPKSNIEDDKRDDDSCKATESDEDEEHDFDKFSPIDKDDFTDRNAEAGSGGSNEPADLGSSSTQDEPQDSNCRFTNDEDDHSAGAMAGYGGSNRPADSGSACPHNESSDESQCDGDSVTNNTQDFTQEDDTVAAADTAKSSTTSLTPASESIIIQSTAAFRSSVFSASKKRSYQESDVDDDIRSMTHKRARQQGDLEQESCLESVQVYVSTLQDQQMEDSKSAEGPTLIDFIEQQSYAMPEPTVSTEIEMTELSAYEQKETADSQMIDEHPEQISVVTGSSTEAFMTDMPQTQVVSQVHSEEAEMEDEQLPELNIHQHENFIDFGPNTQLALHTYPSDDVAAAIAQFPCQSGNFPTTTDVCTSSETPWGTLDTSGAGTHCGRQRSTNPTARDLSADSPPSSRTHETSAAITKTKPEEHPWRKDSTNLDERDNANMSKTEVLFQMAQAERHDLEQEANGLLTKPLGEMTREEKLATFRRAKEETARSAAILDTLKSELITCEMADCAITSHNRDSGDACSEGDVPITGKQSSAVTTEECRQQDSCKLSTFIESESLLQQKIRAKKAESQADNMRSIIHRSATGTRSASNVGTPLMTASRRSLVLSPPEHSHDSGFVPLGFNEVEDVADDLLQSSLNREDCDHVDVASDYWKRGGKDEMDHGVSRGARIEFDVLEVGAMQDVNDATSAEKVFVNTLASGRIGGVHDQSSGNLSNEWTSLMAEETSTTAMGVSKGSAAGDRPSLPHVTSLEQIPDPAKKATTTLDPDSLEPTEPDFPYTCARDVPDEIWEGWIKTALTEIELKEAMNKINF